MLPIKMGTNLKKRRLKCPKQLKKASKQTKQSRTQLEAIGNADFTC